MLTDAEKQTMQSKNCLVMIGSGIFCGLLLADSRPLSGEPLAAIIFLCAMLGLFRFVLFCVAFHNRATDISVPVPAGWLVSLAPLSMLPAIWFCPNTMGMPALTLFLFDLLLAGTVVRQWPVEPISESNSKSEQEVDLPVATGGYAVKTVPTTVSVGGESNA